MSFEITATKNFERKLKKLAKKYKSIKTDLSEIFTELEENPEFGTPLGKGCFKIRISISSKGKGKSAGARLITSFFKHQGLYLRSDGFSPSDR